MNRYNIIKISKKSVITKASKHSNSTGLYYSYGNKCNFGLIKDSSVSQYIYQIYKSKFQTELSDSNNNSMQHLSADELLTGLIEMSAVLPTVGEIVYPVLNAHMICIR